MQTNVASVFAAGDEVNLFFRQIAKSARMGVIAAISAKPWLADELSVKESTKPISSEVSYSPGSEKSHDRTDDKQRRERMFRRVLKNTMDVITNDSRK
jgi:hypothetical protein